MKKGWLVVFGGFCFNITIGVVYSWSVFSKKFSDDMANGGFEWSATDASLPYTIAIAVWGVSMIFAGMAQDRFGPRKVASLGAILLGVGMFITSLARADFIMPAIIGFGLFCGIGVGLGYAAATPAAVKWFNSSKKGMVTGIVVSGMGLASVIIAPLSEYLLSTYGINTSFRILGIAFTVLSFLFAQLINNPPKDYKVPNIVVAKCASTKMAVAVSDATWTTMVKNPLFYILWLQFVLGTSAGLMIIGHLSKIVVLQSDGVIQAGFLFVATLSIFNATGRVVSGFISDRLGQNKTLMLVCSMQILAMILLPSISSFAAFVAIAALVGFNYGSCMPLFPSMTANNWGAKNLGLNYGVLYTSWGLAGVVGPMLGGIIVDKSGSYKTAYFVCAVMLLATVILGFVSSKIKK